jgi:hypothetical protein
MPSGLWGRMGENAELSALDIKKAFSSGRGRSVVHPGSRYGMRGGPTCWKPARPTGGGPSASTETATEEIRDENTGENPQAVPVRRINARLLLDATILPTWNACRVENRSGAGDEVGFPARMPNSFALSDLERLSGAARFDARSGQPGGSQPQGTGPTDDPGPVPRGEHAGDSLRTGVAIENPQPYGAPAVAAREASRHDAFRDVPGHARIAGRRTRGPVSRQRRLSNADYDHDRPAPSCASWRRKYAACCAVR